MAGLPAFWIFKEEAMTCPGGDWHLTTAAYEHQRAAVMKLSRLKVGLCSWIWVPAKRVQPLN